MKYIWHRQITPLLQLSVLIRWRPAIIAALTTGEVKAGLGGKKEKRETERSLNPDPGAEHFQRPAGT